MIRSALTRVRSLARCLPVILVTLAAGVGAGGAAIGMEGEPVAGSAGASVQASVDGLPLPIEPGVPLGEAIDLHLRRAATHRIIRIVDDPEADFEAMHRARLRLIRSLRERGDFAALVLPVGLYEGAVVDRRLREGVPAAEAAPTLYRVWRESPAFLDLLGQLQLDENFEVLGGLSRFHATAKGLYALHLEELLAEVVGQDSGSGAGASLVDRVREALGGTDRLAAASGDDRERAREVVGEALAAVSAPSLHARFGAGRMELEQQFLRNWLTFLDLEEARARGEDLSPVIEAEKRQNLRWLLQKRHPRRKLIWWTGRGDEETPLPTREPLARLELSVSSGV